MLNNLTKEVDEIIDLYAYAKKMRIKADSFDDKGCIGLAYELSYAYDHFMRAIELEKIGEKDLLKAALCKVKGHLIRCAYDSSEIVMLDELEVIDKLFSDYNKEDITVAIPNYFTEILSKSYRIKEKLSELKNDKGEDINFDNIGELNELVNSCNILYDKVKYKINTIINLHNARKIKSKRENIWKIVNYIVFPLLGICVGIIGWII